MKNLKETILGGLMLGGVILVLLLLLAGMGYCATFAFKPMTEVPRICM